MKTLLLASLLCISAIVAAQNNMDCPMHAGHQNATDHAAGVDTRGDHAMGFSHEKTTHHFTLLPDGGTIAVDADSNTDTASRDEIRAHLTHIAAMFSASNFNVPMFIHDKVPPGVPTMKQQRAAISYAFQATPSGGLVRITAHNPDALKAVHEFLQFQIEDHRTGDPTTAK